MNKRQLKKFRLKRRRLLCENQDRYIAEQGIEWFWKQIFLYQEPLLDRRIMKILRKHPFPPLIPLDPWPAGVGVVMECIDFGNVK